MTSSVVAGDYFPKRTGYFHTTTVKQNREEMSTAVWRIEASVLASVQSRPITYMSQPIKANFFTSHPIPTQHC